MTPSFAASWKVSQADPHLFSSPVYEMICLVPLAASGWLFIGETSAHST